MLIVWLLAPFAGGAQEAPFRVAFWNVENYFDTRDDSLTMDDEFTPQGQRHWTRRRFEAKRDALYKVIVAMGAPAVMGLAEVENDAVLSELVMATPLRHLGYDFVHFDSPDQRGVDCALLFRKALFTPVEQRPITMSDSTLRTRDILFVAGTMAQGDTLLLLVNHWPSKLGGSAADEHRLRIAQRLCTMMDSLHYGHPAALVLAMGDFNAAPDEEAVALGLGFQQADTNTLGFRALMASLPPTEGAYYYQGQWSHIDQFFVAGPRQRLARLQARVFRADFLLVADEGSLARRPFRTYQGFRYLGGFSDHLPIFLDLE